MTRWNWNCDKCLTSKAGVTFVGLMFAIWTHRYCRPARGESNHE